jgi:hypothetical protein
MAGEALYEVMSSMQSRGPNGFVGARAYKVEIPQGQSSIKGAVLTTVQGSDIPSFRLMATCTLETFVSRTG